ncbi:MAG: hypothetical protein M0R17_03355 [Candidatus Omnitrophica bacterium]|jgi:hypothetical protein|nr:hypothetical protein [Candidatus Omnitrophota bacterium]
MLVKNYKKSKTLKHKLLNDAKFKKFLEDQKKEIEIHKWIESEKCGHDLQDQACCEWIEKFAAKYRKYWEDTYGKIFEEQNGMCCSSCKRK